METHNEEKRGQFGGTSQVQIRSRRPSFLRALRPAGRDHGPVGHQQVRGSKLPSGTSHWNTWRFGSLDPVLNLDLSCQQKWFCVFKVIHRLGLRVEPRRARGLIMDTLWNISWFSPEQKNEVLLNSWCYPKTDAKLVLLSTTETMLKMLLCQRISVINVACLDFCIAKYIFIIFFVKVSNSSRSVVSACWSFTC